MCFFSILAYHAYLMLLYACCCIELLTGGIAGGCGAAVGSPFFLVKARLQGQSKVHQIRYALAVYTNYDDSEQEYTRSKLQRTLITVLSDNPCRYVAAFHAQFRRCLL
jgi:Mitochondrial carrier protein